MERWEPIVDEATPVDVTEVSDAAVVEPIVAETSEPDAVVETPAPVEAILDVVAEPSEAVVEAVVEPVEAVVEPVESTFCPFERRETIEKIKRCILRVGGAQTEQ
ncbi:hypothetical protein Ae201684P_015874 [Aphanomyces euteiches]|nr:hypothetical protein Ae201684P_015874 [Aphanomyces euteiches]